MCGVCQYDLHSEQSLICELWPHLKCVSLSKLPKAKTGSVEVAMLTLCHSFNSFYISCDIYYLYMSHKNSHLQLLYHSSATSQVLASKHNR